ncbi:MAG TPA: MBL fold metallo-hydrolase [Spirochaetota bacterium]|nr:MBL fold metallo-hydrolase [Spirochaetota bacterium]HPF06126.1 MBL fold metallo-hydrolase [Spirochaetota bacterium]HPR37190.1 MBL fold metallo-hydrolase [Spirochaetota bacterium]HRX47153.1 MBL fold metallo-hydrolase [Spirochaetota bacterium]
MSFKEVYPGIFMITERGISGMLKPPVNLYVITGSDGLIFDGGYGSRGCIRIFDKAYKEVNRICRERGVENRISRILLSHAHADHFSGLSRLKKKYNLDIILTERMSRIIPDAETYRRSYSVEKRNRTKGLRGFISGLFSSITSSFEFFIYRLYWGIDYVKTPDTVIEENTKITINGEEWDIFHSPGHSDDHITLYNPLTGVLFSGDNIMRSINVWLGPPRSDLDMYDSSLEEILLLDKLELILSAHGSPVTEPGKRIREILAWRSKRVNDVLEIIRSAGNEGITIREILSSLYPGERKVKHDFARGWVELTLRKLMEKGSVQKDPAGRRFFSI